MAAVVETLDQRLRDVELAAQSNSDRIKSHEEICAERYANINESISGMRSILVKVAVVLITSMGGILVKLVFFGGAG